MRTGGAAPGAYAGHGWVYDPDRQAWRPQHLPPAESGELDRQVADREPALREWCRTFDTAAFLASTGLTGAEIELLQALLIAGDRSAAGTRKPPSPVGPPPG